MGCGGCGVRDPERKAFLAAETRTHNCELRNLKRSKRVRNNCWLLAQLWTSTDTFGNPWMQNISVDRN